MRAHHLNLPHSMLEQSRPMPEQLTGAVLLLLSPDPHWMSDEKLVLCSRIKCFTGIKTFCISCAAFTCPLCNRAPRREQVCLAPQMPPWHSQSAVGSSWCCGL